MPWTDEARQASIRSRRDKAERKKRASNAAKARHKGVKEKAAVVEKEKQKPELVIDAGETFDGITSDEIDDILGL